MSTSIEERKTNLEDEDPYNADAWAALLMDSKTLPQVFVDVAESALSFYPSSVQLGLVTQEENSIKSMELLFERCLKNTCSVSLWLRYLNWNFGLKAHTLLYTQICDLYEKAIEQVGLDVGAGPLWSAYLSFVKDSKVDSMFEEQLKMDTLRKTYQRAVVIPMVGVETIWKDYDTFENSLNKIMAKKTLSERSSMYMSARAALKERWKLHECITPLYIVNYHLAFAKDVQEIEGLRKIILWEKSNPLNLEDVQLEARIGYAFRYALFHARPSDRLWFDFYIYKMGKSHQIDDILSETLRPAVAYLKFSLPLHFGLIEALESHDSGSGLIEARNILDDLIERHLDYIENIIPLKIEIIKKRITESREQEQQDQSTLQMIDYLSGKLSSLTGILTNFQHDHCSIYVFALRVARRTEGISLARQYFSKARKLVFCSPEVYILAANIEYFVVKDPSVAFKIFELGMKTFSSDETYIISYLKLLLLKMDDSNAKALFERALKSLPNKSSHYILWKMIFDYERDYGYLQSLSSLCDRKISEFPQDDDEWNLLLQRNSFLNCNIGNATIVTNITNQTSVQQMTRSSIVSNHMPISTQRATPPQQPFVSTIDGLVSQPISISSNSKPSKRKSETKEKEIIQEESMRKKSLTVPIAIKDMLSLLCRPDDFKGPVISVDELVSILQNINIPI